MKFKYSFTLELLLPVALFSFYFGGIGSNLTLALGIFALVRAIFKGVNIHKEKKWNKTDMKHDQRTRMNDYRAGFAAFWAVLVLLFTGSLMIKHSIISLSYMNLIGYTILAGIVLWMIVKDYKNATE